MYGDDKTIATGELRTALAYEIYRALGLNTAKWRRYLLAPALYLPTRYFSDIALRFDRLVTAYGFCEACRYILPGFIQNTQVYNQANAALTGPLVIASNHPGTYDALILAASFYRQDLKMIAREMPFLRQLNATQRHLIFSTRELQTRAGVLRAVLRHLQSGGALLIFPSGTMDPDPDFFPGAEKSLERWSPSLSFILRQVPETKLVLAVVSNIISPPFWHSPLIRWSEHPWDQQLLAEMLQVICQMIMPGRFRLNPRVTFSHLLTLEDLQKDAPQGKTQSAITYRMLDLLSQHQSIVRCSDTGK